MRCRDHYIILIIVLSCLCRWYDAAHRADSEFSLSLSHYIFWRLFFLVIACFATVWCLNWRSPVLAATRQYCPCFIPLALARYWRSFAFTTLRARMRDLLQLLFYWLDAPSLSFLVSYLRFPLCVLFSDCSLCVCVGVVNLVDCRYVLLRAFSSCLSLSLWFCDDSTFFRSCCRLLRNDDFFSSFPVSLTVLVAWF